MREAGSIKISYDEEHDLFGIEFNEDRELSFHPEDFSEFITVLIEASNWRFRVLQSQGSIRQTVRGNNRKKHVKPKDEMFKEGEGKQIAEEIDHWFKQKRQNRTEE